MVCDRQRGVGGEGEACEQAEDEVMFHSVSIVLIISNGHQPLK